MRRSAGSTIARASSGSRSCSSSVEPLISANSAVTVLRSPSRFSEAGESATRIGESFGFFDDAAAGCPSAAPIAVPHFLQNRAPGLSDALHAGQVSSSFDPHDSQNDESAGLSLLHFAQRMGLSTQLVEQRLRVLQVGGVEAFGEPVVDF